MDCSPYQIKKTITSISTVTCLPVCFPSSLINFPSSFNFPSTIEANVNVSTIVNVSTYVNTSNYYISNSILNYSTVIAYNNIINNVAVVNNSTVINNSTIYYNSSVFNNNQSYYISNSIFYYSTTITNNNITSSIYKYNNLINNVAVVNNSTVINNSTIYYNSSIFNNYETYYISNSVTYFSTVINNTTSSIFAYNNLINNIAIVNNSTVINNSTIYYNSSIFNNINTYYFSTIINNTVSSIYKYNNLINNVAVVNNSTVINNSTIYNNNIYYLQNSTNVFNISSPSTVFVSNIRSDTFDRLISITPTTLFTSHPAFTPQYETVDYASTGTGSVFFDISNTIITLSANGSGGRAIRQTREYQLYQPGKSHKVFFTWCPKYSGTFDSSVALRAGIYDDYRDKNTAAGTTGAPPYLYQSSINGGTGVEVNQPSMGHFFELSGNEWFVVERANSSNNIANVTRVPQSNWNVDTLNSAFGNNPSGFQLSSNANTAGLYTIERQWLGVGIVTMGLFYSGSNIICHVFDGRNYNRPYTHLPKLPIRYEIEKVSGGSANTATTATICESSQIGGDYTTVGNSMSLPTSYVLPGAEINTTIRPIIMMRLQQKYCRATFKLKDVELYSPDGDVAWNVFKNSQLFSTSITGPLAYDSFAWIKNPDPRSLIEYFVFNANAVNYTINDGMCIRAGFAAKNALIQDQLSASELIAAPSYCSDIKGNSDVLLIAAQTFGGGGGGTTNTVAATMRWIEIV